MVSNFESAFFAGNRQRLKELFTGTAPIVITANGLIQRNADTTFAYSQDANFWYLTGIDEPDIVLVMDRDKEYLIVPERSVNRQTFDGTIETSLLHQRSGIKDIYNEKQGWEQLASRLKKVKYVATLTVPPPYVSLHGFYTNPARAALVARIKILNSELNLLNLNHHLTRLRMIKQSAELVAIQSAIDITIVAFKQTIRPSKILSYSHEYELEAELTRGFRRLGASGHAFEPIVASGSRACTVHNFTNVGELKENELVVIDVGADVEHYSADITRTIGVGRISRRQKAVHNAVLEVQKYALNLLGPGVLLKEYEKQIEQYMGEKLRELGLIKTISRESVRTYFPHATSHFLGLNVHDTGDYDRPLESGMVLTVEPGIYIMNESLGVRIEDDILITDKGNKILSDKLPRELS